MTFDRSLPLVLASEGGFVDDPADRGGRTNKGITQKTYDAWRSAMGLPPADVRDIPDDDVATIYLESYWKAAKCDDLPWPLSYVHMDCAVNSGVRRAALTLQSVVGVTLDGTIGVRTLRAVSEGDPIALSEKYCTEREGFYRRLAARDASQEKFLKGWLKRVEHLRQAVTASIP